jgi:autotransporter translocation and assembly factor TamB
MKRKLKYAAFILGALVLVLLLFVGWIVYTEAGLRFAVARLPDRLGKVSLKIENVHGTIAGGFGADRVDVEQERAHVRVDNGAARVNVWPLLVGRIAVREAHADSVLIEVKRRLTPPPKTPPKFLPRLLSISAESAAARSPRHHRAERATHGVHTDVSGAGIVGHKTIRIFEGSIIYGVLQGPLRSASCAQPIPCSSRAKRRPA